MVRQLHQMCSFIGQAIEKATNSKDLVVNVVDRTPFNPWDYLFTFFITVFGAFIGGWFAFRFNRMQEKKKQDYDDKVERIEKIYVPLCVAIEKLMTYAYGRDTGDYGDPSIFVLAQNEWRDYRKALRTLFLAQNRRLMLQDELVGLKAYYEKTEALNTEWEDAFYEMMTSYEDGDADKCLSREDAILDIACCDGTQHYRPPLTSDEVYVETVERYALILNPLFEEYIQMVESTYRDYLGKIGVSDMELDISLLEKTQP